jgi:hypothetical protein
MANSLLPNIIERSYQLAKSGNYLGTLPIREQLLAEGYTHADVASHLAGPTLKKTLSNLCREAQGRPKPARPVRRARAEI